MSLRLRSWLLPSAVPFLIIGILLGRITEAFWIPLVACLPAIAAIVLLRGGLRFAGCLALVFSVGTAAGSLAWHPVLPPEGDYAVQGVITGEVRRGSFGQVRLPLSHVTLNGREFSAGAYWTFYLREEEEPPADLQPGRAVSFQASLYHPSGADNPDGYDFREELLRQGITVGLYGSGNLTVSDPDFFSFPGFTAALRHRLSAALTERMGEEAGGYTAAFLLGTRLLIPSEDRAAFANLGIAHILSVSGFHVAVLTGMLAVLFRLLRLRPSVRFILYAVLLTFYCGLCGMNQPVIRASLLLLAGQAGRLLNRPRIGIHLLSAVIIVMLLFSPVQLTGVSFILSFSAVLGIIVLGPAVHAVNPFRRKLPSDLWESAGVMLGAQLGILAPELYFYQKLPLMGFLINLPVMAYASLLIALDWVALLFLPVPFVSDLLCRASCAATELLTGTVRALSALPGITVWTKASDWMTVAGVLLILFGVSVLFRLKWKSRTALMLAGVATVAFSLIPLPHRKTEYIQFSVGNADAAVLWDQDHAFVLDAGLDDGVVSAFLRRRHLVPEAVILTHLHTDHAGGLLSLIRDEIPIPLLYLPAGALDQQIHEDILSALSDLRASGTEIRFLGRGDEITLPSGSMTVLWPEEGKTRQNQDANHYSLVSLLRLHGTSLLQAGDITGSYEAYSAVPADILKAAHHGSSSSSLPATLSAISPQTVLLSCSSVSRHQRFAEKLGAETALFSTAQSGAITVVFEPGRYTVVPFLPSRPSSGGV